MAELKLVGTIGKVMRIAGKPGAQVVISVPAEQASNIPLGDVYIAIESLQTELLPDTTAGKRSSAKIRGRQFADN